MPAGVAQKAARGFETSLPHDEPHRVAYLTRSRWRSSPKLTNLTFRLSFVRIVLPVKGIFLRIPGLCCTENLPKLPSFSVNPLVPRLLSAWLPSSR
jgi:hypothetical protein